MYSGRRTAALPAVGFPIRTSPDQSLVSGSPTLFAATHVLLRLLSPRHPSCALSSLVFFLLLASLPLPLREDQGPARWFPTNTGDTIRPADVIMSPYIAHMQLSKSADELGLSKPDRKPTSSTAKHRLT